MEKKERLMLRNKTTTIIVSGNQPNGFKQQRDNRNRVLIGWVQLCHVGQNPGSRR